MITGIDEEGVYHVFEYPAAPEALCRLDEAEVVNIHGNRLKIEESVDLCPVCKKRLPVMQQAHSNGFTMADVDREEAKMKYWRLNGGTMHGFDNWYKQYQEMSLVEFEVGR